jgi:DNA-binding response OmpR family regulator
MIVDDNPDNLALLEQILVQKGYDVRSFPRGRFALVAAAQNPPDLILLDVNMPEMDGYEVCQRLKLIEAAAEAPVLFISALNEPEDKVRGFRAGAVDFITKPFQLHEVRARVETHLKLRRAQRAERELLEKTLSGATKMLSVLIHTASPELATRTQGIQGCVCFVSKQVNVKVTWEYNLAATLSLIGCVNLPEDLFQKAYSGENVTPVEEAAFRTHPQTGCQLLLNIPRLEAVAAMIRWQLEPRTEPDLADEVRFGAHLLHLAVELDRRIYRGLLFQEALHELKLIRGQFLPELLAALEHFTPPVTAEFHHRSLSVIDMAAGMTLEEDVISQSNKMTILRKGTILNDIWIERLNNFAKYQGVNEPLRVRVPGLGRFRSLWFQS